MQFSISRTSIFSDKPIDEAIEIAKEVNNKQVKLWVIEINSLEELLELSKKYNNTLIIDHNNYLSGLPSIEIYDYYRE